MAGFKDRIVHAWNAFVNEDEKWAKSQRNNYSDWYGPSSVSSQQAPRIFMRSERSIVSSIYTRLSMDVASVVIRHVRHDDQDRYIEDMKSDLNNCLTVEANIDQAARAFRQEIAMTLFDQGVVAIVPVDTTVSIEVTGGFDIKTMRVGEILEWYPEHVKVSVWRDKTGRREELTLPKKSVAIIYNPLYSVMNEPNSTLQRLIRKLGILDAIDEQSGSGKLDIIIQLPYVIKTDSKRQQAEKRRQDIEFQLKGSKYGIAYTDGTEKITQLNRPAENNLLKQVEYLTAMLYSQLGLTEEVMNGTADEAAMKNYQARTIGPIVGAMTESMARTFLTKTARTQGQTIDAFIDAFSLISMADLAEIADKFTRNEILSSNEIRQIVGFRPDKDPKSDKLINSNMPADDTAVAAEGEDPDAVMNEALDAVDAQLDDVFSSLGVEG